MSKTNDRNSREVVGEKESIHKMDGASKHRPPTGTQARMNVDRYLAMPEYQDKVLFWATSRDGDVEYKISQGAQPVPKVGVASKIYKGINDRVTDQYEIQHSVSVIDGIPEDNYLLFMTPEDYDRVMLEPDRVRNGEIRKAMGIGRPTADSVTMPGVSGLKTYAPNVGGGLFGLSVSRGDLTHDV
jgi:hypothetical protein